MHYDGQSFVALDIAIKFIIIISFITCSCKIYLTGLVVTLNLTQWFCCGKTVIKNFECTHTKIEYKLN